MDYSESSKTDNVMRFDSFRSVCSKVGKIWLLQFDSSSMATRSAADLTKSVVLKVRRERSIGDATIPLT